MKEIYRKKRNQERLKELYPAFSRQIAKVITDLELVGLRPRIQDAWRSQQDQLRAFNEGHSKLKFGFHNITGQNGEKQSLAVDLLDDDAPVNMGTAYILRVTATAEKYGLTTGVRWGLPSKLANAVDAAISAATWNVPVKVGWDPVHIESANFTVAQAKGDERPKFP